MAARIAWSLVVVLLVLRHDVWFWSDRSLVFGFVPIGLFWQVLISVGAGIAWYLVSRFAWPEQIEAWAGHDGEPAGAGARTAAPGGGPAADGGPR